jgi:REP element-mobilizing transposase RayT
MKFSNELPEKCQKCAKSMVCSIHKSCEFCMEIELQEDVLCYLNRCIQDAAEFKCQAFQPILKMVDLSGSKKTSLNASPKEHLKAESITRFLQSDKIKYNKALALQKLNSDPEGVFIDIKYHFAWNVTHRMPIFSPDNDLSDFVNDTFSNCNELVGGFVSLLWLAPDHVHLYVNSDGESSVETIVKEIKQFSKNAILEKFIDIKEKFDKGIEIWDAAYFSETIG